MGGYMKNSVGWFEEGGGVWRGRNELPLLYRGERLVWLKGGAIFSAILGICIFFGAAEGRCYFVLLSAILGSSATPKMINK